MSSIHYIGHGRLESSPENLSILHVVSHELSHVQEFKNEAFRNNADITEIRVKIDLEMRENGKMVAVSGETSAVTRKKEEKSSDNSLYEPYTREKKSDQKEKTQSEDFKEKQDIKELNLLSRKESLEARLKSVESEIKELDRKLDSESIAPYDSYHPKKQELNRERRKVEEEIRLLKMEEEIKKNFQFLADIQKEKSDSAFSLLTLPTQGILLNAQA